MLLPIQLMLILVGAENDSVDLVLILGRNNVPNKAQCVPITQLFIT